MVSSVVNPACEWNEPPSSCGRGLRPGLCIGWTVEASSVEGSGRRGVIELGIEIGLGEAACVRAVHWPLNGASTAAVEAARAAPVTLTRDEAGLVHVEAGGVLRATLRPAGDGQPARLLWAATPLLARLGVRPGGAEAPALHGGGDGPVARGA